MGSVQSLVQCPKCGGYMYDDYYYRTGEEYRYCKRCGVSQSWTLERDKNGGARRDDSGKLIGKYSESGGYGVAYIVSGERHVGALYSLTGPLSEQDKENFLKCVRENDSEGESYLVTFDPSTNKLTQVFGKMPPDFDDENEEIQNLEEQDAKIE